MKGVLRKVAQIHEGHCGCSGVTMVEVLITAALMGIIFTIAIPLFNVTNRGYTSLEIGTSLTAGSQDAINRIQHRLTQSKRIFGTADAAYLARVTPRLTTAPLLSGALLPTVDVNASISVQSASFSAVNVGNCLLFASMDSPLDFSGVADTGGGFHSVRIDRYIFNFYYLTEDAGSNFAGAPRLRLYEWHSVPYPDFEEINNITDNTLRRNVIGLIAPSGSGTFYAWDSTSTAVGSFWQYTYISGTVSQTLDTNHLIITSTLAATGQFNPFGDMIKLIKGMSLSGFSYGVSPNSTGMDLRHPVPAFAVASGKFPSGFEVQVVGPSLARQVCVRLVLAAKGNSRSYESHEEVMTTTVRDIW